MAAQKTKKTSASRKIRAIPHFSKWVILVSILAIAGIGAILLRYSHAATPTGYERLAIYNYAKQEVGHKEYDARVLEYTQGNKEAWCADFVSWVYKTSGYPLLPQPNWRVPLAWHEVAGVPNVKDTFLNAGGYKEYSKGYVPSIGDVVIFGDEKSHVGIFVSLSGTKLTTIEGNSQTTTPNSVVERTYDNIATAGIKGYGNADVMINKALAGTPPKR